MGFDHRGIKLSQPTLMRPRIALEYAHLRVDRTSWPSRPTRLEDPGDGVVPLTSVA